MNTTIEVLLPVNGKVLPLVEVNDYLFNKRIMGEGVAIEPYDNFVYSPVDGEITLVYDTRHAIAIKTDDGLQILLHIGIDSVKLEGRGFATYIRLGDRVNKGDKILFFDKEYLEKKVSSVTPIVITNPELVENIDTNFKASKVGDVVLTITLK